MKLFIINKTVITIFFTSSILFSCAEYDLTKKTGNQNLSPTIPFSTISLKSRSLQNKKQPFHKNRKLIRYSNKKIYFLTLYSQYLELKSFSKITFPKISICPNFNSCIYNKNIELPLRKLPSYSSIKLNTNFPILHLPIDNDSIPKVHNIISNNSTPNDLMQKAFDNHVLNIHNELKKLCEYGTSNDYYIFENIIAYSQNKKIKASHLFKTILFSNMTLLNSLKSNYNHSQIKKSNRSIASISNNNRDDYLTEVFIRLNL